MDRVRRRFRQPAEPYRRSRIRVPASLGRQQSASPAELLIGTPEDATPACWAKPTRCMACSRTYGLRYCPAERAGDDQPSARGRFVADSLRLGVVALNTGAVTDLMSTARTRTTYRRGTRLWPSWESGFRRAVLAAKAGDHRPAVAPPREHLAGNRWRDRVHRLTTVPLPMSEAHRFRAETWLP